ncbi:ABC transporter permease [Ornithinicoccus halotolerans]|uniref:ABC transporter permease n=1 Tax=Ornithinicoccus halotolerans TaxID=1748220 RepID=UPI0012969A6F|nr:ABC transporter permease [Ornithinicoccus halotolerans]
MSALRGGQPVLAVAAVELRRFLRDRSNIFFVFIFPLMLVLVLGLQFGGGSDGGRVTLGTDDGVEGSQLVTQLEAELAEQDVTVEHASTDQALERAARGRTGVAVLLDADDASSYEAGRAVEVSMVAASQSGSLAVQERVRAAVSTLQVRQGQLQALVERGLDPTVAREALAQAEAEVATPTLQVATDDELGEQFAGLGRFDLGASGQLLLFTFLATLAGSSTLIDARRLGVITRTVAAPVTAGQVLLGQVLGRFAIGMFQGGYIVLATALIFDVDWGSPWLTLLVLAVFALVAAGAAMLMGSLIDHEGTAVGVGVGAGLVLAAMGGSMMPLELFPETMRSIANLTPHAWGYQAFAEIQRHDGGLLDVLPQLGVLAAMAVLLLAVGSWALRRSLSRAM